MNAKMSDSNTGVSHPTEPLVEGEGVKVVRLGSEEGVMPQDVLGLQAISQETVGSVGLFMARHRVPPGAHSSLHSHTNCETAVYVLRGRGYAYYGEAMDGYVEAGPGDFVYIPADLAHVVGCPADGEPFEYTVARNAPEEIVATLRKAADLPIGPDGQMREA